MKHFALGLAFGLWGLCLACAQKADDRVQTALAAPKLTREFLLAHGFKDSRDSIFTRQYVRLSDVSRDLGFDRSSLCPVDNQPLFESDERTTVVGNSYVIVQSEARDTHGFVPARALDKPDAICTVQVLLNSVRKYLKTDASPRIRVKSVEVPKHPWEALQIAYEFAAMGKKPVTALATDFRASITGGTLRNGFLGDLVFPRDIPKLITVSPGKPLLLKVDVRASGLWAPGEHVLRVGLWRFKGRGDQSFGYEWEGDEHWSDEYKFVVK